jgi:hypothetical protein
MQKYLIPKEGLLVRDPVSFTPLPKDGMFVDWNGNAGRFWRRRVKQGDCSIGKPKEQEEQLTIDESKPETTSNRRTRGK